VRASTLAAHPRATLAAVAAFSALTHALLALRIHSILYFPDEWLYAGLSRSVFTGPFAHVHGERVSLWTILSYTGPVLTSPVWLLHNVSLAHHLSQAVASAAFASAVAPVYLLARRLGLESGPALVGAALSQLIPAGSFTATLLAEPYAYPVFLWTTLVAVDALDRPRLRQLALLGGAFAALLVTGGLQFLVVPLACGCAWMTMTRSVRGFLERLTLTAATVAAAAALVSAAGGGSMLQRVIGSADDLHYSVDSILGWAGVNGFVVAVASGWVIVPGALLGLGTAMRSSASIRRAFARLSAFLIAGLVAEGALWSANGNGVYERFTFYVAPLLALGFLLDWRNVDRRARRGRGPYALLAYGATAAALLLPLSARLAANEGHAPTLLALSDGLVVRVGSPALVWAPLLALLAVGAAVAGAQYGRLLLAVAGLLLVCITASAIRSLRDYDSQATPAIDGSIGTTLLVNPAMASYAFAVPRTLFWSPSIDRVAIVGGGAPADTLPGVAAELAPPHDLVAPRGTALEGPFAVGTQTSAWRDGRLIADGGLSVLRATPDTIAFGWGKGGELAQVVEFFAAGNRTRPRHLVISIRSAHGSPRYAARCTTGTSRPLPVDTRGVTKIAIVVPPNVSEECRLSVLPAPGASAVPVPAVRARLTEQRDRPTDRPTTT
jgi:hypothetical protein